MIKNAVEPGLGTREAKIFRPLGLLIALFAISAASFFMALLIGTFPISALQVIDSLLFPAPGVVHDVIWRLRAPHAAAVFGCGGLLALAGVLLERLFGSAGGHIRRPGIYTIVAAGGVITLVAGVSLALLRTATFSAIVTALWAGSIGCMGLIAPQVLRSIDVSQKRWIVPMAVLFGGSLLTTADDIGRWLAAQ
jgi:ABC-type Fe3+-siderophore transport system permease subunit